MLHRTDPVEIQQEIHTLLALKKAKTTKKYKIELRITIVIESKKETSERTKPERVTTISVFELCPHLWMTFEPQTPAELMSFKSL